MKYHILNILFLSNYLVSAQTGTVGPSGQGITSGTRSAFLDALGGSTAGKGLFQISGNGTSGQVPQSNGSGGVSWATKLGSDLAEADAINTQWNCIRKYANWNSGSGQSAPIRYMVMGDSYSVGIGRPPKSSVAGVIGLLSRNTSGTVTSYGIGAGAGTRFNFWITGAATTLAVGASCEWTSGGASTGDLRGDRACVAFIKESGGGSFDLQYASNGTGNASAASDAGWTNLATISTANATTIGAFLEYTLPTSNFPSYRLRIKNVTTAPVTIIATGIYNSIGGGVIDMSTLGSAGGWDLNNCSALTTQVFQPIWAGLRADLIVTCFADAGTEWEAGGQFFRIHEMMIAASQFNLTGVTTTAGSTSISFSANSDLRQGMKVVSGAWNQPNVVNTINSSTTATLTGAAGTSISSGTLSISHKPDVIIIGGNVAADETGRDATDTAQKAWAIGTQNTWINGRSMFRSYAEASEAGLMGDNTHLSVIGTAYRNMQLWSRVPVGTLDWGGLMPMANRGNPMIGASVPGATESSLSLNAPITVRGGGTSGIAISDRTNPMLQGNYPFWYGDAAESFFGVGSSIFARSGSSSVFGWHPGSNNLMLGGIGNLRWRGAFTGVTTGYTEKTGNYTLATDDFTVNVTSGSPIITLPAATATNVSTSFAHNVAAGIAGKLFMIINSGAGTVTLATTSSQTIDGSPPGTLAAGARIRLQSTGGGYVTW